MHHGYTWFLVGTFTNGGVKQSIYHPLKQWSQTNMVTTPHDSPHSMHHNHVGTMATDGSTWPSTCERWHGAQFCTWSLHTWPSQCPNNKTPKVKTFFTHKMTWPTMDLCLLNQFPMANHGNYMSQSPICPFSNSHFS